MIDFLWLLIPLVILSIELIAFMHRKSAIQSLQFAIDNIHNKSDSEKLIIAGTVKHAIDIIYLLLNVFTTPFVFLFLIISKKNNDIIDNALDKQPNRYDELVKHCIICSFHTSFILSTIIAIEVVLIMGIYVSIKKSSDNFKLMKLFIMMSSQQRYKI